MLQNRNLIQPFTLPRWIIEMEDYPEYKIINRLVQEPNASVADALAQLAQLTSAAINTANANPVGTHPWHTFCSLIEVAKRTQHDKQAKLVEFTINLQKVKVADPATGEQLKSEGDLLWTEMPAFGYTAADDWNEIDVTDARTVPEVLQRYENFIALLAQISAAYGVDYDEYKVSDMDFSYWSMRAFKEAFTDQYEDKPTNSTVRTACMWLIHASDRLWSNITHRRVFDKRGDNPGVILTQEMWESWEQGLLRVRDTCSTDTIEMVDRALSSMKDANKAPLVNGSG